MRFLHTADWQIGMRAAHVGAAGEKVRGARLDAAKRVVAIAQERGADFMVLAGDTFEDNDVEGVVVRQITDILRAAPCPVYVLPGNHDPLIPGSVFDHKGWETAGNVRILRSPDPIDVGGAMLFPCPIFEARSAKDPTEVIPPRVPGDDGLRIGIAHGSVVGIGFDVAEDFPIFSDAPLRRGLDYLAVGHWHSTFLVRDEAGLVRLAYSGTHETTKFGESNSGNVLLVEIDGPGAPPHIEAIRTGGLSWYQYIEEVTAPADVIRIRRTVEALENPAQALVDIRLRGALSSEGLEEVASIEEILTTRFTYGRVDRSRLSLAPTDTSWIETLPAGPVRAVASRLLARTDAAGREALMTLYAITREEAR